MSEDSAEIVKMDMSKREMRATNEKLYQKLTANLAAVYATPKNDSNFQGAAGYNVESYQKWPYSSVGHDEAIRTEQSNMTRHFSSPLHTRIMFKQKTYSAEEMKRFPEWLEVPDWKQQQF